MKDYIEEFYMLSIRAGNHEPSSITIARYINELEFSIQDELSMLHIKTIEYAYQYAIKAKDVIPKGDLASGEALDHSVIF